VGGVGLSRVVVLLSEGSNLFFKDKYYVKFICILKNKIKRDLKDILHQGRRSRKG
jgi:hypothetical protein